METYEVSGFDVFPKYANYDMPIIAIDPEMMKDFKSDLIKHKIDPRHTVNMYLDLIIKTDALYKSCAGSHILF